MKFKMTFPENLNETMQECMKNEKDTFEKKWDKSTLTGKFTNWAWRKVVPFEFTPTFEYEFVSDTEVVLEVMTGLGINASHLEKKVMKKLKKYESFSDGKIKVEVMEEGKDET